MGEVCAGCDIVCFNNNVQTDAAKYLCLENIQDKFFRPNVYDLGTTCKGKSIDYWFNYCTEEIADIYLLHIFVTSHVETNFSLAMSVRTDFTVNNKSKICYLSSSLRTFEFNNVQELKSNYVTSYEFSSHEIDLLSDAVLYIPISFKEALPEMVTAVMASHNFSDLLTDEFNSDFTIESGDGEKFNVHKSILSAHSEMFRAMFQQSDSVENQSNYVKLTDETAVDLKYLLEFIYTGAISDIYNCDTSNLLILSDKYIAKGLKDLTEHILIEQLSLDNAFDIHKLAEMCNADLAKIAAESFIRKYYGFP